MEYKDLAGREIKVGDYVIYAALWSRSAVLKFGKVVSLAARKHGEYSLKKEDTPTLRVTSVDNFLGKYELQNHGTPITLGFLDRVLVIDSVPDNIAKLLSQKTKRCDKCKGRGWGHFPKPDSEYKQCDKCNGKGFIVTYREI